MSTKTIENLFAEGLVWSPEALCKSSTTNKLVAPFGIEEIDSQLPFHGLPFGEVHEWFIDFQTIPLPPSHLFSILIRNGLRAISTKLTDANLNSNLTTSHFIFWIDEKIWPTPFAFKDLAYPETLSLKKRSFFIKTPSTQLLLWSLETSLRSPAASIVIAYLPKIPFPITRKLQLLAKSNNTLGLFVRPLEEVHSHSASSSKWKLLPHPSQNLSIGYSLELINYKGSMPKRPIWKINLNNSYNNEELSLHLSPNAFNQPDRKEAFDAPRKKTGTG